MRNSGYTYIDRIAGRHAGLTVLEYYCAHHAHFTKTEWLERIESGQITRNKTALRPNESLSAGQILEYRRPPWEEPETAQDIRVLHDDDRVMIFDKPDGMPVLPGGMFLENSMVLTARRMFHSGMSPLHRLGRGTTGAIIFTKSAESASKFSALMRGRGISKIYLALAHGACLPDGFVIDSPIGRVPHKRLGSIHDITTSGKTSVTMCTTLARNHHDDTALLRINLVTGRTHQIRIHLAFAGHALLGDRFYAGAAGAAHDESGVSGNTLPGDPGYILHSWKLRYEDPFDGAVRETTAPPRSEIVDWLASTGYVLSE